MAVLKLSQISQPGTYPGPTDFLVGVTAGGVDQLWPGNPAGITYTNGTVNLGIPGPAGTTGQLKLANSTNVNITTVQPAAVAAATTLTLPIATTVIAGLDVSQIWSTAQTFANGISLGIATFSLGTLTLAHNVSSFTTSIQAGNNVTASRTYTWPTDFPGTSGFVLSSTTAGALSWVTMSPSAANEATDTTCFPLFATDTTATTGLKTNANLAFNSNTGLLTLGADCTVVGTLRAPITQNSQSTAYTTVLADAGKHILHPTADNNARTFTIDSNANVAYVIGTTITFVNQINTVTIAITSDTMTLMGAGTTGSRTLAANGIATAMKIGTTSWVISGTGLT